MRLLLEIRRSSIFPPILANGDIGMLIDYRNCQFQDVPSYKKIKCVGGNYMPSIYRAGRRTDKAALACFGRIEEKVGTADCDSAKPDSWVQTLDIARALSKTENTFGNGKISSEAFVHADMPVIAVSKKFEGENVKSYVFEYLFSKRNTRTETPLHMRIEKSDDGFSFELEKAVKSVRGQVSVICDYPGAKTEISQNGVAITLNNPKGEAHFYIVFADDYNGNDFKKQAGEIKSLIASKKWDGLKASHEKSWENFWGGNLVSIPDKELEAVYYTAIYNLKCWSTKWSIPVGILPSHWEGKYFGFTFFNPALCASGHIDEALKVGRFWRSILNFALSRAGKSQKGVTVGARFSWLTIEDGREGLYYTGRWLDHVLHMCNISLESYTCFRYTNDMDYLRETCYPLIRESAEFFRIQTIYTLADGRTVIGKVCDLERLPTAIENAFLTTTGAMATFNFAAEAAEILGVDADKAKEWRRISAELSKYLPNDGEKYLPYPNAPERSVGSLSGLYPYGSVGADDKLQRAAVYDFEKNGISVGNMYIIGKGVCSWYAAWLSCALSRLGDGNAAYKSLKMSTDSAGKFYEIFEINEPGVVMSVPWCSSPQGTFIQALNEQLLQCEGDTVKIAPAVPDNWKDFSFKLNAYDDIAVSVKFEGGNLAHAEFTGGRNTSGREKTVIMPNGKIQKLKLGAGQKITVK